MARMGCFVGGRRRTNVFAWRLGNLIKEAFSWRRREKNAQKNWWNQLLWSMAGPLERENEGAGRV